QAGDRPRGDGGAHHLALRHAALHRLLHGARPEVQQLGPVRERGDDDAGRAGSVLRHLLLPARLRLLRAAAGPRPPPAGLGEPLRLRPDDGSRRGRRGGGAAATPEWRQQTYTKQTDPGHWQIDRLWKPGDSIQLAIGQKDLLVTPLQMARFYAIVANGGKLVTPHLLLDVEQQSASRSPGRLLPTPRPAAPEATNVDAQALGVVREGLFEATHSALGTSAAIFGGFPIPISGKTGT